MIDILYIITASLMCSLLNYWIGRDTFGSYTRYLAYPLYGLLAVPMLWLISVPVYYAIIFSIGYWLFRQKGPTIGWLCGMLRWHHSYELPNHKFMNRFILKPIFKLDINSITRYNRNDLRKLGLAGGALRGLYIIPLPMLSYFLGISSLPTAVVCALLGATFGLIHWAMGVEGYPKIEAILGGLGVIKDNLENPEYNMRLRSEIVVGTIILAPQIWLPLVMYSG